MVCEATGGYERLAACALADAELPVVVANPRQVRHFAKGQGLLAKTDKIDAIVLALFAEHVRPEVRTLPDGDLIELRAFLTRRDQLVQMRQMERNRLPLTTPQMQKSIEATIQHLDQQLAALDKDLDDFLRRTPLWQEKLELLRSTPGIGDRSACAIIAFLPELGQMNRKEAAALVGVAPFNCDSGQHRGTRRIWGGRAVVRRMLYMATMSEMRDNPRIKAVADRLRGKGKPGKVVIVACMRKLLTTPNAMVKTLGQIASRRFDSKDGYSVVAGVQAGKQHLGEAEAREVAHPHRVQLADQVVALVLHHAGVKAVGLARDRVAVGVETGVADAPVARHHAAQVLLDRQLVDDVEQPALVEEDLDPAPVAAPLDADRPVSYPHLTLPTHTPV